MIERGELLSYAEQFLELHRGSLFIDPFYTIKLEIVEGDFFSDVIRDDKSALSWIVKINPSKHADEYDVQYSIVESLIKIICEPLGGDPHTKSGVIARLTKSFADLFTERAEGEDGTTEGENEDGT